MLIPSLRWRVFKREFKKTNMAKAPTLLMAEIEQDLLAAMNSLDKASAAMLRLSNKTDDRYASRTDKAKTELKQILNARYDWLARKRMKK